MTCKSAFFCIHSIAKIIRRYPSQSTSWDYRSRLHNIVFIVMPYCTVSQSIWRVINKLQLVQNSAARLVRSARRQEHITPILRSLHWLPVHFRIIFKILLLTYKALNGLAPYYIRDLLRYNNSGRTLSSSNNRLLDEPRANLICMVKGLFHGGSKALEQAATPDQAFIIILHK